MPDHGKNVTLPKLPSRRNSMLHQRGCLHVYDGTVVCIDVNNNNNNVSIYKSLCIRVIKPAQMRYSSRIINIVSE